MHMWVSVCVFIYVCACMCMCVCIYAYVCPSLPPGLLITLHVYINRLKTISSLFVTLAIDVMDEHGLGNKVLLEHLPNETKSDTVLCYSFHKRKGSKASVNN